MKTSRIIRKTLTTGMSRIGATFLHRAYAVLVAVAAVGACSCGETPIQRTQPPLDLTPGEESAHAVLDAECIQIDREKSIQIEDPMRVSNYTLESLGVVEISAAAGDLKACMDAAIRDGAEIFKQSDTHFTAFYPTRFESWLDYVQDRTDIDAVEGRWSVSQKRIIPGAYGRKLNTAETTRHFMDAVYNNKVSFQLVIDLIPALSSDISSVGDFQPNVMISEYRTHFSNKKNRTINVKLAASFLDGIFLMPGADFSYNAWVGERTEARGFKDAPVIEQGQMVEGIGGGACQVSSTVHAAALLAGLGILERSNHSLPSSYIPLGMDSVVSYPILDLRVKNTLARPVVLHVFATNDNELVARFYSDQPLPGKVIFRREVTDIIPFKEIITVDPELEPGTIHIKKYGKVGYKVQRARLFYEDGKERYEKLLADTYQQQPQQVFIASDVTYPKEPETE